MIVSTVRGRARVRARVLRSPQTAARLAAEIAAIPGVLDVRPNPGAGCLVVTFEPDVLQIEVLEERSEALCQTVERVPRTSKGGGVEGLQRTGAIRARGGLDNFHKNGNHSYSWRRG